MGFGTLSLKGRALRLLSQREHSRAELVKKLSPHVQEGESLTAVLDDLEAKDFINETRVVESVVHRRAARLGAARIRQELQGKGLAGEMVAKAIEQLHATELERAQQVWARKFGAPAPDAAGQARQMRFLLTRGFSADAVRRVLRGAAQRSDDQ